MSRIAFGICIVASAGSARGELVLSDAGKSSYQIVVADDSSPSTKFAAEELQSFLMQMTGAKLPIVSDSEPLGDHAILVGESRKLRAVAPSIELDDFGDEGYQILTRDGKLIIAGGNLRGNLYGVYGFLQDHLGCRWFTPEVSRVPQIERLAIGEIDDRRRPQLDYREPFVRESCDANWSARNRVNSVHAGLDARHGGHMMFGGPDYCHTFEHLIPPKDYFADHPEYFALVHGKRQCKEAGMNAQLCCTNPDVERICADKIRAEMQSNPEARVFSLSQNDAYEPTADHAAYLPGFCECERCQEVVRREGSQMGPVLQLVNHVAAAIEEEFPENFVDTIAYQWTRTPPKHLRPRANVIIRLCSSGACCCSHPMAKCDFAANVGFRKDFAEWNCIAPNLWIWYYATNFNHLLAPFPNYLACPADIRYLSENGARGVFIEDMSYTADGELSQLNSFVWAQCLWNPEVDVDALTNEFLAAYYGSGATAIREYIDMLMSRSQFDDLHVTCLDELSSPLFSIELLVKANELWQHAETDAQLESESLERIRRSRLSIDYVILERARTNAEQDASSDSTLIQLAKERFPAFAETLRKSNITSFSIGVPLDKSAYCAELASELGIQVN